MNLSERELIATFRGCEGPGKYWSILDGVIWRWQYNHLSASSDSAGLTSPTRANLLWAIGKGSQYAVMDATATERADFESFLVLMDDSALPQETEKIFRYDPCYPGVG